MRCLPSSYRQGTCPIKVFKWMKVERGVGEWPPCVLWPASEQRVRGKEEWLSCFCFSSDVKMPWLGEAGSHSHCYVVQSPDNSMFWGVSYFLIAVSDHWKKQRKEGKVCLAQCEVPIHPWLGRWGSRSGKQSGGRRWQMLLPISPFPFSFQFRLQPLKTAAHF